MDTAEIIKAVEEGDVTAMLVFGADPAAEVEGAGEALKKLDLLMVADTELTATAKLANVVLPESSPFEKEGTFTNEGGRVQQLSRAVSPLGGSCSTWETASALAKALGAKWTFESAAKVFDAMAREVSLYKGLALTAFPAEGVAVHAKAAEPEAAETKETEPEKAD